MICDTVIRPGASRDWPPKPNTQTLPWPPWLLRLRSLRRASSDVQRSKVGFRSLEPFVMVSFEPHPIHQLHPHCEARPGS